MRARLCVRWGGVVFVSCVFTPHPTKDNALPGGRAGAVWVGGGRCPRCAGAAPAGGAGGRGGGGGGGGAFLSCFPHTPQKIRAEA